MGLIKSGIKYGGLYFAAREGFKAYEKHNENKQQQQQQSQYPQQAPMQQTQYNQQQPQYPGQSRDLPSYPEQQQQLDYQDQPKEAGFHQVWCNGRCGGRCGAKEALMNMGYPQQPQQQQLTGDVKPPTY